MDDPPTARECTQGNRRVGCNDHPERDRERLNVARCEEHTGDDAHRLLGVVRAMVEAEEGGRHQLQTPEPAIDPRRRRPPEDPMDRDHEAQPEDQTNEWRKKNEDDRLGPAAGNDRPKPGLRDRRAGITADEGVRRTRRQAGIPGDQIPDDRADQAGEYHRECHDVDVDHARADRLGDGSAERERCDEVEEGGPDDRLAGREDTRRNDRGDRVRRVVEAVDIIEEQRDGDDRDDDVEHR